MYMTEKAKKLLEDSAASCVMGFLPVIELAEAGYSVEIRTTTIAKELGRYSVCLMKDQTLGQGYDDELHTAFAKACLAAVAWGR